MAQFDFLIIFPLIWVTIISLIIYYSIFINIFVPILSELLKLRVKQIGLILKNKFMIKEMING